MSTFKEGQEDALKPATYWKGLTLRRQKLLQLGIGPCVQEPLRIKTNVNTSDRHEYHSMHILEDFGGVIRPTEPYNVCCATRKRHQ